MATSIEVPNRAASRRKRVARIYSGPDDVVGVKHTKAGKRSFHRTSLQRDGVFHPSKDSSVSNHERVVVSRARRQRELDRARLA